MTSEEAPNALLQAFDWLYQQGLRAAGRALQGSLDPDADQVRRLALEVAGKVRDTAIKAEAAELASFTALTNVVEPPSDPLEGAMWIVHRCMEVVKGIEAGELDTKDEVKAARAALHNMRAAILVEPLESRVEAARILREGRKLEQRRPGPKPQTALFATEVMRVH